jgi:hypothetical protein
MKESRMKSCREPFQTITLTLTMCAVAVLARAQTAGSPSPAPASKPASSPASRPAAVEAALKYAPDDAVGVIHIEAKALVKDLFATLAKDPEFKDIEANTVEALSSLAGKIDSLDIFLESSDDKGLGSLLVVVRGPLTAADVN